VLTTDSETALSEHTISARMPENDIVQIMPPSQTETHMCTHIYTGTDLLPNTSGYKSAMRGQLSPAYRPFCTNTTRSATHHVEIVNRDNVTITTIITMMQMK